MMPTNKMPQRTGTTASAATGRKPLCGEARAAEMLDAADIFETDFFKPTIDRLLALINHTKAGVRIFATIILGGLIVDNMPLFNARTLADVAFVLKTRADQETDERVRRCLWHHLTTILDTAVTYGAACRAGAVPE